MQTAFITIKGYEKHFPGLPVEGVDNGESILNYLLHFPPETRIVPLRPERLSQHIWKKFEIALQEAINSRAISINTISRTQMLWATNALVNKERTLAAKVVQEIPRNSDTAIIVGNGPSLKDTYQICEQGDVFSCWHAASKLQNWGQKIDYIGHCDARVPENDFEHIPLTTSLIATPTVAPEFIMNDNPLYMYLSNDNYLHSYFAKWMDSIDHRGIVGTIVHMLTNSARYAGYKNIILSGVDLCSSKKDDFDFEGEGFETTNKNGEKVWTCPLFTTYKNGLEWIAVHNPDLKLFNASPNGLEIRGFKPYD